MNGVYGDELSKLLLEFQSLSLYDKHIGGKGRKCYYTFHRIKQCWDLGELWTKANLPEEGGKWRKIGFTTEAPKIGNSTGRQIQKFIIIFFKVKIVKIVKINNTFFLFN